MDGIIERGPPFSHLAFAIFHPPTHPLLRPMPTDEPSASEEAGAQEEDSEIVREISLDEFEPYGTLAVTGAYFILLLVLYALLYFVEFAARAPSIIE